MHFSKEYVGYLAREVTNKLVEGEFIETPDKAAVTQRINAALLEELTLEDRINDEVRIILDTYADEMQRSGANYQEMFKKIKNELVRKYKAVADERISREKVNKLAHAVADTLAEIENVDFLEDRNTIRHGSAPRSGKPDGAGSQNRRCRPAEDRKPAPHHPGRLAGVGHPLPQVLQRGSEEAGDLKKQLAASCWSLGRDCFRCVSGHDFSRAECRSLKTWALAPDVPSLGDSRSHGQLTPPGGAIILRLASRDSRVVSYTIPAGSRPPIRMSTKPGRG